MHLHLNKKFVLIFNIILLLFLVCLLGMNVKKMWSSADRRILPSVVGIQDGQYRGNGSILYKNHDEIIIVTTKHLLENGEEADITFFDRSKAKGEVIFISEEHDVGFVKISTKQLSKECLNTIKAVECREEQYSKLKQDDIMQYGIMDENDIVSVTMGKVGNPNWYVEEFSDYMLYNYCEAVPGMSGCGTFDEKGIYIGMLIGGYDNESACLPVNVILKLYNEIEK